MLDEQYRLISPAMPKWHGRGCIREHSLAGPAIRAAVVGLLADVSESAAPPGRNVLPNRVCCGINDWRQATKPDRLMRFRPDAVIIAGVLMGRFASLQRAEPVGLAGHLSIWNNDRHSICRKRASQNYVKELFTMWSSRPVSPNVRPSLNIEDSDQRPENWLPLVGIRKRQLNGMKNRDVVREWYLTAYAEGAWASWPRWGRRCGCPGIDWAHPPPS
jgi:hypothetical protein